MLKGGYCPFVSLGSFWRGYNLIYFHMHLVKRCKVEKSIRDMGVEEGGIRRRYRARRARSRAAGPRAGCSCASCPRTAARRGPRPARARRRSGPRSAAPHTTHTLLICTNPTLTYNPVSRVTLQTHI